MSSPMRRASLGLWLGAAACLIPTVQAQTAPTLSIQMQTGYAGLTITGTVSTAYAIQATTNLSLTNGWVALTNVVLTTSPWGFIDYASSGIAQRFYRASTMITNAPSDTNSPPDMALIPAGSFLMGDTFNEGGDWTYETPAHTVFVSAFYMDKTEVTKALWDDVYQWAIGHGYSFDHAGSGIAADHPVHSVYWYDVVKWCNARSEKEGRVPAYYTSAAQTTVYRTGAVDLQNKWVKWSSGYRLPTEAEWEKAARGRDSGHRFPWSDVDTITHNQANYRSASFYPYDISSTRGYHPNYQSGGTPYTSPVGSFAPNGYGLYDMAGNVFEWCWDLYDSYSSGTQADPRGSTSGSFRVLRGSSWAYGATGCRAAYRDYGFWPVSRYNEMGFRSVLPPGQ